MNTIEQLTFAIDSNLKIEFRMESTPEGHYILFHPYAIIKEVVFDKVSVYGLIEKHWSTEENYDEVKYISIEEIAEIKLNSQTFQPRTTDWTKHIHKPQIEILHKLK